MMQTHKSLWHRYTWIAYLAVFIAVTGHASSEFISKLISNNSSINGPEISVWRFFLGGLGMLLVTLAIPSTRDLVTPMRKHGFTLLLLSIFGVAAAYLFFHWALDFATVPQVAIVVTTIPIFVGLVNLAINKVPISKPKIISGIGAVLGIAFLMTDGTLQALTGNAHNLIGIFMAGTCAFLMSAYLVIAKPYIEEFGAIRITSITIFLGGIALWIGVGVLFGKWVNFASFFSLSTPAAIGIVVLVIFNTIITQWLWIGGLSAVPDITRGAYLFFLKPPIAAFLAVVYLGTSLGVWQILAIIVICCSVAIEAALGYSERRRDLGGIHPS